MSILVPTHLNKQSVCILLSKWW